MGVSHKKKKNKQKKTNKQKKKKKKKKKKKRAFALIRNDVCMNNFKQAYKAAVEYNQISTNKRELGAAFLHSCNIAIILPLTQKTIGTGQFSLSQNVWS